MKRSWIVITAIAGIGLLIIGVLLISPKPPIPGPIKRQVTSALLVPQGSDFKVDRDSAKYDSKLKLLTYNFQAFGTAATASEQPTPEMFADIPDAYGKLVDRMREYSVFESETGTVHLTHPPDQQGKQVAVMNAKGTLMFIKPEHDLGDDQWRQLFRALVIVK
jgi:hypothetical protein